MLTPYNILRDWINEACILAGRPDLATTIKVEWNSRFTRRMGDASPSIMRIRLSIPLWDRVDEEKHKNTVIHEVCHLLNPIINGRGVSHHGTGWQRLMRICGQNPTRCHKADRTGLARHMPRVATAKCRCRTHKLTKILLNKMLRGLTYRCTKCRTPLVLVTEAISAENPAI
jgi:predicted SprT family Zn-dependent metalloprotease